MKLKGINIVERHIEKVVLALGALFGLYVAWAFFLSSPYNAKSGNQTIPWNQVEDRVAKGVEPLEADIRNPSTDLPDIPIPEYPHLDIDSTPVTDAPQLLALGGEPGVEVRVIDMPLPHMDIFPPSAPTNVMVSSTLAVLGEYDVLVEYLMRNDSPMVDQNTSRAAAEKQAEKLQAAFPGETEHDVQAVSVQAELDFKAWQDKLKDVPEENQIPPGRVAPIVVDVLLERQERNDATGEWGVERDGRFYAGDDQVEVVPPMPGQLAFRNMDGKDQPSRDVGRMLDRIRMMQAEIVSPEFLPLDKGTWSEPSAPGKNLSPEEQRRLRHLNEQMENLRNQIRLSDKRIEKLEEEEQQRKRAPRPVVRPQPTTTTTRRDPTGMGASGGRQQQSESSRQREELQRQAQQARANRDPVGDEQKRQDELNQRLDDLQFEKDKLLGLVDEDAIKARDAIKKRQKQMQQRSRMNTNMGGGYGGGFPGGEGMGGGMYGPGMGGMYGPGMGGMYGPGMGGPGMYGPGMYGPGMGGQTFQPRRSMRRALPQQLEDGKIQVMSHDITAEPGKTYRYRIRIGMLNPLYHLENLQPDQKKENYNKLMLVSDPTDWTKPVQTDKFRYFFVTGATSTPPAAQVEVFRFYAGEWRKHEFSVQPGGLIGGDVEMEVPVDTLDDKGDEDQTEKVDVDMSVNQVVVDLVFPDSGSAIAAVNKSPKLLYLDLASNQLVERSVDSDRGNSIRDRLLNKISEQNADEENPRRRRRG